MSLCFHLYQGLSLEEISSWLITGNARSRRHRCEMTLNSTAKNVHAIDKTFFPSYNRYIFGLNTLTVCVMETFAWVIVGTQTLNIYYTWRAKFLSSLIIVCLTFQLLETLEFVVCIHSSLSCKFHCRNVKIDSQVQSIRFRLKEKRLGGTFFTV